MHIYLLLSFKWRQTIVYIQLPFLNESEFVHKEKSVKRRSRVKSREIRGNQIKSGNFSQDQQKFVFSRLSQENFVKFQKF